MTRKRDHDGSMVKSSLLPIPRPIALVFSLLYSLLVRLRNLLFDRGLLSVHALPCPVISVGNMTVGGTGKTPLIITLARMFIEAGRDVVVLSRGYGRRSREHFVVTFNADQVPSPGLISRTGDEPWLIARRVPGITLGISSKRFETGLEAIQSLDAPLVLLDDAYQHRQLSRTVNLLVIDASRPFLTDNVIPAGRLREPLVEIKRADAVILTRTTLNPDNFREVESYLERHLEGVPVFYADPRVGTVYGLVDQAPVAEDRFRGKRGLVLSAVGNPQSVTAICEQLGVRVQENLVFRDHHDYTQRDLDSVMNLAREHNVDFVITTEKDAVKLATLSYIIPDELQLYVLSIEMVIEPDQAFKDWIFRKVGETPHVSEDIKG